MLYRYRQTLIISTVQIAISVLAIAISKSYLFVVLSLLTVFLAVAQCLLTLNGLQANPRDMLTTMFPINRPVLFSIVFFGIAVMPFVTSCIIGIPPGLMLPGSDNNSLLNLVSNILHALQAVFLLFFLTQSKQILEFPRDSNQMNYLLIIFLDVSLLLVALFVPTQKQHAVFHEMYNYFWLCETFNYVFEYICSFVIQFTLYYILYYLLSNEKSGNKRLYKMRYTLLFEPYYLMCLFLGILSTPDGQAFSLFLMLCPLTILILIALLDLLGIQINFMALQTPTISKVIFCFIHLLPYSLIIYWKLSHPYVTILLIPIVIFIVTLLVFSRLRLYLHQRALKNSIDAVNDLILSKQTSFDIQTAQSWFNQKMRMFHFFHSSKA